MSTSDLDGKVALITGANAGIGRVTAEVLAGRGARVLLACRSEERTRPALDAIRAAARNDENVMPSLVDGSLANCTLGEMVQALADVYGRYTSGPEW